MKEQIKNYACINFTGICITSVDVDQNFVTQHKEWLYQKKSLNQSS